jgi:hypothetical protein
MRFVVQHFRTPAFQQEMWVKILPCAPMRLSFSSQDACLPSRERGCKSLLPHQKSRALRFYCIRRPVVYDTCLPCRKRRFDSFRLHHALIEELAVSPGFLTIKRTFGHGRLEPGVCGFDSRSAHHNLEDSRGFAFLTQLVEDAVSNAVQ